MVAVEGRETHHDQPAPNIFVLSLTLYYQGFLYTM